MTSVSVTHNGRTRNVRCSQSQYSGNEYLLQRTSRTTPFLRQLELFSGVSIPGQGISSDRTIRRITDGIKNLDGINEEDSEDFRKDGRQIILTSINFDSGELRIVEKESKNVSKSRHRRNRTIKDLWDSVIEDTDESEGLAQEFTEFLDNAYPRDDFAKDGQKEEILKMMRKTIHFLRAMEERIKELREKINTSDRVNSERAYSEGVTSEGELKKERDKLLEAIQCLITFKKSMLAIFDAEYLAPPNMDVEKLDGSLKDDMSLAEILKSWEFIKSLYSETKIKAIRRWLLENVVSTLTVLLIDNSKSMITKNKANASIEFAKQFIAYLKQSTDLVALAVITFGGDPKCLEQFTLIENFNANSLDKLKFQGSTPLARALLFCKRIEEEYKEKICSDLKMNNSDIPMNFKCVMVTDLLPTELTNDYSNGIMSNPKDECQETSEKFATMMREFKEAMETYLTGGKSSIVVALLRDNQNQLVDILRREQRGYVLDISPMSNTYPILADYDLHQKYISEKEIIHKLTKKKLAEGNLIRGDDHPRAEIYQQLSQEWQIVIGTKTLSLSDRDNANININLTELRTTRSKVFNLHLNSKLTICRIYPKTEYRGISSGEDNSKHEAYTIKITLDSGELYIAELVKKRRVCL